MTALMAIKMLALRNHAIASADRGQSPESVFHVGVWGPEVGLTVPCSLAWLHILTYGTSFEGRIPSHSNAPCSWAGEDPLSSGFMSRIVPLTIQRFKLLIRQNTGGTRASG